MGTTRNVDMSSQEVKVKKVTAPAGTTEETPVEDEKAAKTPAKPRKIHVRSQKYTAIKSKVDRNRKYDALSAVELIKQLSYAKFGGTVTADVEVISTDVTAEVTLPHLTGKQQKVVIADDTILKQIEAGQLDFDVLVSSPQFMPKLAKYARILGPKGLMPNPKLGTITDNPEEVKQKLENSTKEIKADARGIIHSSIGKVSWDDKKIIDNAEAILGKINKVKIEKAVLSSTMGVGMRVKIWHFLFF